MPCQVEEDTDGISRFLDKAIGFPNLNSESQRTDNGQLLRRTPDKKKLWADIVDDDDDDDDAYVPLLAHEAKGDTTTANQRLVMKQEQHTLCVRQHFEHISDDAAARKLLYKDDHQTLYESVARQTFYGTKLNPSRIMKKKKSNGKFYPAYTINSDQPILACECQVLKHMLILLCSGCYFGDKICNCVQVPLSPSQCRRMADNLRMIFPAGFRITLLQYSEKPVRFMHGFYTCFDRSFDFIPSVVVDRFNHILFVGMACSFFPSNVKRLLMNEVPV